MNMRARPELSLKDLLEAYQKGCDEFAFRNPQITAAAIAKGEQADEEHQQGLIEVIRSFCEQVGMRLNVTTDAGIVIQ